MQNDDKGNLTFKATKAVIDMAEVTTQIQTDAGQQPGMDVTANCGTDRIRIEAPGATFECETQVGTDAVTVVVTVEDVDANLTWAPK